MKKLVKDNVVTLFVSVAFMIVGILAEPLLAILGGLIGMTCLLATAMERHSSDELVLGASIQQKEYRNQKAQVSYGAF